MRAAIGLGANLGDRLASLRAARDEISKIAPVLHVSSIYETAAVGPPQPAYLNAALLVDWSGDAIALLDALLAIESSLGRVRREKWGPRTIDLDVLWIEGAVVADARLAVPHPELRARAFALVPLLEVAPDATDPATGEAYASIARDDRGIAKTSFVL